ncbi:transcriptional regulator [Lysinibacillus sp. FSL K6-0075]|uniref:transcriptional regulator n=1 Tax=Lysinibacillus sp. FSL K6-0075 TaxID=2921415 RepID=UPI003159111D
MRDQLVKAMQRNQLVNMMYMAKGGAVSKRRIKIIKMVGDTLQAYCFTKQAKRTFLISNILAVNPVFRKERDVV